MIMLLIGAILAVSSASRTTGIVWLVLGSLIYTIPELVPELGPLRGCNF